MKISCFTVGEPEELHQATAEIMAQEPSPWGILSGVRPTKIMHRFLDLGMNQAEAQELLKQNYLVSDEKAGLIAGIAGYQRKWLGGKTTNSRNVSVYIGIPYCPSRCLYCSFPAYAIPSARQELESFLQTLWLDMSAAAQIIKDNGLSVQSVYIGGGTPTSLKGEDFEELVSKTVDFFTGNDIFEFTVEAGRPDSLDDMKLAIMKQYGVSRVSVNPQTMQEKTLKRIGRKHTVEDIINIFGKMRSYNFPVINMDVIAGLPGEDAGHMRDTLEQVLALGPENITVHTLAIKKGSMLKDKQAEISLPEDREVRAMLAIARDGIAAAGMLPYYLYRQKYMVGQMENVGYTKPGLECVYNIQMMEERQTVIGIGPNAATKAVDRDFRLARSYFPKDINAYINGLHTYVRKRAEIVEKLYR